LCAEVEKLKCEIQRKDEEIGALRQQLVGIRSRTERAGLVDSLKKERDAATCSLRKERQRIELLHEQIADRKVVERDVRHHAHQQIESLNALVTELLSQMEHWKYLAKEAMPELANMADGGRARWPKLCVFVESIANAVSPKLANVTSSMLGDVSSVMEERPVEAIMAASLRSPRSSKITETSETVQVFNECLAGLHRAESILSNPGVCTAVPMIRDDSLGANTGSVVSMGAEATARAFEAEQFRLFAHDSSVTQLGAGASQLVWDIARRGSSPRR